MLKKLLLLTLLGTAFAAQAEAAAPSTYRDIARLRAMNQRAQGIRPAADGKSYTTLRGNAIERHSYTKDAPGELLFEWKNDKENRDIADYQFSPDGKLLLLSIGSEPIYRHSYTTDYYLKDADGLRPILTDLSDTRDASFSPDGRTIAFSSGNNLYLYDIVGDSVRPITTDGAWNRIINGTTDWVYEEECAFTKAYAFSPDGQKIAYLRFDESLVPVFEMMRYDGKLYNEAYSFKYPKAGDANSVVDLYVYDLKTGETERVDVGPDRGQYILQPEWTPDGRLCFQRMNRRQNHFEAVLCNPDGTQQVIYDERSPKYVDHLNKTFYFLEDGRRFIVREETSTGYMHLYLYGIGQGVLHPITQGEWEVTDFVGLRGDKVYYISTESSPLKRRTSTELDSTASTRSASLPATVTIRSIPAPTCPTTSAKAATAPPPAVPTFFNAAGKRVRTLYDNAPLKEAARGGGASRPGVLHLHHRAGRRAERLHAQAARLRPGKTLPRAADPVFRSGIAAGCRRVGARLGGRARHAWLYRRVRRSPGHRISGRRV